MTNTLHAHVETESRDCDGMYSGNSIIRPEEGESADEFYVWMMEHYRYERFEMDSVTEAGVPAGWDSSEAAEEGYRSADVTFCTDDCEDRWEARDHSAEAAGY